MDRKMLEHISFEMGAVMLKGAEPLDQKLDLIVRLFVATLGASRCSIMIINHTDMTIEVRASSTPQIIGLKRNLSDVTVSTRALIDDKPYRFSTQKKPFFEALESSTFATEDSISIPLKHLGKKLGVVNLTDFEKASPLDLDKEQLATSLMEHFSVYLHAALNSEELESRLLNLEDANRRLVELDHMRTDFTGFIVHDLKGPISTIMGNLDMLNYEPLTPQQEEYLSLALEDVYKLQAMVMDILDVLKLEAGAVSIYREDADIREILRRELKPFEGIMSRRNIKAVVDAESLIAYIDENLIGRVFVNILRNAIEHSPDGGEIKISAHFDSPSRQVLVSIADQGKGVPDEIKGMIFEKYYRSEGDTRTQKTGSGLGLTFSKMVVEAHGGIIGVEDSESGGARFIFTLPETFVQGDD